MDSNYYIIAVIYRDLILIILINAITFVPYTLRTRRPLLLDEYHEHIDRLCKCIQAIKGILTYGDPKLLINHST